MSRKLADSCRDGHADRDGLAMGGDTGVRRLSDPVAGSKPSSVGMPGAELVQDILGWGQWLGMAACAMVIIYGAATWHGFAGASAGRSVAGKTFVMAGGGRPVADRVAPDDRQDAVLRRSGVIGDVGRRRRPTVAVVAAVAVIAAVGWVAVSHLVGGAPRRRSARSVAVPVVASVPSAHPPARRGW